MLREQVATSKRPLVSVVIPTRNRYSTLIPVVRAILSTISDPDLELVIQDNTQDNEPILELLEVLKDTRVSYEHTAEPVSIVENTEMALRRATGEYITFIGDDDLVSPFIVDVARRLIHTEIEAVTYPPAYYWWPTITFAKPSRFHQPGAFWFPINVQGFGRTFDPVTEIARVLESGAVSIFNLPRLYHGLVRRAVLETMRRSTGAYVNGASPDMALAVSLSLTVRHHAYIDFPLTIYGASKHSGGGWTVEGKHFGRLEEQAHLPRSTIDNWNQKLPPVWSECTVYPQSVYEVLRANSLPDDINYTAFYAAMMISEPGLRAMLYPLLLAHLRQQPREIPSFLMAIARKTGGRMRRALNRHALGLTYRLEVFPSPLECMRYLQSVRPPSASV